MPSDPLQPSFEYDRPGPDGFSHWRKQREKQLLELSKNLGLPLNHQVEVWLRGGIRLRGILKLKENLLFLPERSSVELMLGEVCFSPAEIESCIRVD
jgi:small nuclear ribonucleoprotein (snRNP)-like protein